MWLQNQRMMLFKCMVQLDTSIHFCCFVSFRLSYWCFDIMISEGRDLQVACFRPRSTWNGHVFVLFHVYLYTAMASCIFSNQAYKSSNQLGCVFCLLFFVGLYIGIHHDQTTQFGILIGTPSKHQTSKPSILSTMAASIFYIPVFPPQPVLIEPFGKRNPLSYCGKSWSSAWHQIPHFCLIRYEPFTIHLLQFPRTLDRNQSMIS